MGIMVGAVVGLSVSSEDGLSVVGFRVGFGVGFD